MFHNIAVLGAGTMGHGIAQMFAYHGLSVVVYDPNRQALENAQLKIRRNLLLLLQEQEDIPFKLEQIESNLTYTCVLHETVRKTNLIIESVPEQLETKRELYQQITPLIQEDTIVASNTSTFALDTLSHQQPFANRMIILHFFNPAYLIPLVEIVQNGHMHPNVVQQIVNLLERCGKVPVVLKRDIPGFIANRLQAAVMREASFLLQSGVADAKQIDQAMTEGPGMRWAFSGPFENADFGGVDVWEKVTGHLFPLLDSSISAPKLIQEKVQAGQLGVKTGSGIYEYGNPEQWLRRVEERDKHFIQLLQLKGKKE